MSVTQYLVYFLFSSSPFYCSLSMDFFSRLKCVFKCNIHCLMAILSLPINSVFLLIISLKHLKKQTHNCDSIAPEI